MHNFQNKFFPVILSLACAGCNGHWSHQPTQAPTQAAAVAEAAEAEEDNKNIILFLERRIAYESDLWQPMATMQLPAIEPASINFVWDKHKRQAILTYTEPGYHIALTNDEPPTLTPAREGPGVNYCIKASVTSHQSDLATSYFMGGSQLPKPHSLEIETLTSAQLAAWIDYDIGVYHQQQKIATITISKGLLAALCLSFKDAFKQNFFRDNPDLKYLTIAPLPMTNP